MLKRLIDNLRGRSVLRLFGTGVLDQALLSATGFAVGLLLIRYTTDSDYGMYVLAQSALLLMMTAQGSYVGTALTVLSPKKPTAEQAQMIGSIGHSVHYWSRPLFWLFGFVALLLYWLDVFDYEHALVATATLLACWVLRRRDYLRTVALIHGQPQINLRSDVIYTSVLVASAVIAAFWLKHPTFWVVLGTALAGWLCNRNMQPHLKDSQTGTRQEAAIYWPQMRSIAFWASFGALNYWVFAQGYNYLLAAKLDVKAVAVVNAVRLLLMPIVLMTVGVKSQLLPLSARWLHDEGIGTMFKRLTWVTAALVVACLGYVLLLWIFRDWVALKVLRKSIPDFDALILLWAAVTVVAMVRDMYQSGLLALQKLKPLAWFCVAGSIASISIILLTTGELGARGAVLALLTAEGIGLIGVLVLTFMERRNARGALSH